jgi:signal transduction histidine kinase
MFRIFENLKKRLHVTHEEQEVTIRKEKEGIERANDRLRRTMNELQERDQKLFDVKEELVLANREIARQKGRLDTIIREMGEGVMVISESNEIEIINDMALRTLGYNAVSEMPSGFKRFFTLYLRKELEDAKRDFTSREITLEKPKNAVLSVLLARLKEEGSQSGFVAVVRDVTIEKRLEQMKSDFVANVSHEIRSPMAPMKESLAIVLEGIAGPVTEKQKKFLQILDNNMERLLRLINDLLDMSKIEAGKIELDRKPNKIGAVLHDAVDGLSMYASGKNIHLLLEDISKMPELNFDRDRIMQVVINLINNALKFTPGGGRVSVSARPVQDGFYEVSVADTGPGMSKEDMAGLFDKYRQLAVQSKVKGTGLGLAISKAIVEMHGGKIWAESEKGRGSVFRFTLPMNN